VTKVILTTDGWELFTDWMNKKQSDTHQLIVFELLNWWTTYYKTTCVERCKKLCIGFAFSLSYSNHFVKITSFFSFKANWMYTRSKHELKTGGNIVDSASQFPTS